MKYTQHLSLLLIAGLLGLQSCKKDNDNPEPDKPSTPGAPIELDCAVVTTGLTLKDHNATGVDYIIGCDVLEVTGGTLKIEAGTTIEFKAGRSGIWIGGEGVIAIEGTADKPVVMRGMNGKWRGIYIDSDQPGNKITHLTIQQTGAADNFSDVIGGFIYDAKAAIGVGGSVSVTNTTVDGCDGIGIAYATSARIRGFSGNTIKNCAQYPVLAYAGQMDGQVNFMGSSFSGNGENYIALYSTSSNVLVDAPVTLFESPVPYLAVKDMYFHKKTTFNAGVTLLVEEDLSIGTGDADAHWMIQGTSEKPVTIRGKMSVPGYWRGILIYGPEGAAHTFSYLDVADGGRDFVSYNVPFKANINVGATAPSALTLNNCRSFNGSGNCQVGLTYRSTLVNNSEDISQVCRDE